MYEDQARTALDFTKRIIEKTGPRITGSAACREGAALVREAAANVCDRAEEEVFSVHPGAFLGFIKVLVVLYAIASPLLAIAPVVSLLLASIGLAVLVLEFIFYREPLDPFYPRKEGVNIVAVLEPSGAVDRQVIVSGHHDSAHIFNFFIDRPELYARRVNGGIGAFGALFIASIPIAFFAGPGVRIVAAILFVATFPLVFPLWRFAAKEGAPGAGDNLVASAAAIEIARVFRVRRDAGHGLERTRIVVASFDAEEAGLRGARAFARRHGAEFAALPTFGYNMDCVFNLEDLSFLTSDLNGSVALDAQATAACAAIANAEGLPVQTKPIAFLTGSTDAAELAKAGVRQTSLIAMKWSNDARASAYHTPADTVEAVEPATVEAAIRIGVRFVERIESGGLDQLQ